MQVLDFRLDEAAQLVELLARRRFRFALGVLALHRDRKLAAHVLVDEARRARSLRNTSTS